MKKINVKTLVVMALCIALSYVGSLIKVSGTIAFDAMPAFFAALILGPVYGGIVGMIGHFFTASISGFPLSIPVHLVIGIMMFVSCYGFGYVYKRANRVAGIIVGVVLNGPIALGMAAVVLDLFIARGAGVGMFVGMVFILTLAAGVNVILASVVYEATTKYIKL